MLDLLMQGKKAVKGAVFTAYYPMRYGAMGRYLAAARVVEGWTSHAELVALGEAVKTLPADPVIVELGSWLGRSAIALAGACELRGDGEVHCVDAFDARGDSFSAETYRDRQAHLRRPLRENFDRTIARAGLSHRVHVHAQGTTDAAAEWTRPIDMLFMDADQSRDGVKEAFELWSPFLKDGAVLAVHNTLDREYAEGHDGHFELVKTSIKPPAFEIDRMVWTTTFARRTSAVARAGATVVPLRDAASAGATRTATGAPDLESASNDRFGARRR